MTERKALVIGISGVTCGGKTTLASELAKVLKPKKVICQDKYYLGKDDHRHIWITELNHINFDVLTSMDMEKLYEDLVQITTNKQKIYKSKSKNLILPIEDIIDGSFKKLCNKLEESLIDIIIVEGFSLFNYKPILPFFHLKYYITLDYEECSIRRSKRVYHQENYQEYFETCSWPAYLQMYEEVKNNVTDIKYIDGKFPTPQSIVLMDIYNNFIN